MVYNHFYTHQCNNQILYVFIMFYNFYNLIFYNFGIHIHLCISYTDNLTTVPYNADDSMAQ